MRLLNYRSLISIKDTIKDIKRRREKWYFKDGIRSEI